MSSWQGVVSDVPSRPFGAAKKPRIAEWNIPLTGRGKRRKVDFIYVGCALTDSSDWLSDKLSNQKGAL